MKILNLKQGFSLIELLVVITIIAILSTVGFTSYTAVTRSGRDALRKTHIEQIRSALEIFRAQNSKYPTVVPNCGQRPPELTSSYINIYPTDPTSGHNYCYISTGSGAGYLLCVNLENGSTSPVSALCGGSPCGGSGCNYEIANP